MNNTVCIQQTMPWAREAVASFNRALSGIAKRLQMACDNLNRDTEAVSSRVFILEEENTELHSRMLRLETKVKTLAARLEGT